MPNQANAGRRIIFAALLAALMAAPIADIADASKIDVNVAELIGSEQKEISQNSQNNALKISYDVLNSGSVEYGGRVRIDIFRGTNGTGYAATLWSKEEALNPGARKTISLYWHSPNGSENWTANARLYRAYEIIEIGNITKEAGNASSGNAPENNLEIESVRAYGDEIAFRVKSKSRSTAKNVVVYPIKHPRAWIFEQNEIGDIAAGGKKSASIHYETGAFREREITLIAASEDGKNYGTKTFVIKRKEGLSEAVGRFMDWLGV